MKKVLAQAFFDRPALDVAPDLIGKYLVCHRDGCDEAFLITETEAYIGPEDKASHSSRGKTERTKAMFGSPGVWYVYFCYGAHWMVNIVTGPGTHPSAVLIRGVLGASGPICGPGRLTRTLKIDRTVYGRPARPASGLWIEDRGTAVPKRVIRKTPRIGVGYASAWAKKPYRFVLKEGRHGKGNEAVSSPVRKNASLQKEAGGL